MRRRASGRLRMKRSGSRRAGAAGGGRARRTRPRSEPGTGRRTAPDDAARLPARTVGVGAGTSPNTIYEREQPGTFKLDEWGEFFAPHKVERNGDGAADAGGDGRGNGGG